MNATTPPGLRSSVETNQLCIYTLSLALSLSFSLYILITPSTLVPQGVRP